MPEVITIEHKILKKNADIALENRARFDAAGVFVVGLVSSPGSGKTSLLERTLQKLQGRARCAVIEGDVQTDNDARRIAALGVPAVQIVTNGTCHLEARMVQEALPQVDLAGLDLLFVENVGNLVCPSSYELGEHERVVLASTTEGEDKPLKYPAMFRKSQVLVLNKIDLLPYVPFDLARARAYALQVNPGLRVFETSCTTGQGLDAWVDWLLEERAARRA
jgi:hydrogenase nickel incorporation protein HypB